MLLELKRLYSLPLFEKAEDRRIARILLTLILASWLASLIALLLALLWGDNSTAIVLILGGVLQLLPLGLLLRGRLFASNLLMVGIYLVVVTLCATVGQGIHDYVVMAYPAILMFSGLVIQQRGLLISTFLTLVALAWLVFGEANGWFIIREIQTPTWADLIATWLLILLAATAAYLLVSTVRYGFTQIQRELAERLRVEAALKRSQARLQALTGATQQSFVLTDREANILTFNRTAAHSAYWIYGANIQEGDSLFRHVAEQERAAFTGLFNAALSGETMTVEESLLAADGQARWWALTFNPVCTDDDQVNGVCLNVIDITARKQAESQREAALEALHQSRLTLTTMLDALPDLLFEVDREGRFYDFRTPAPELLFAGPETFLGKTIHEVMPRDVALVISSAIESAATHGRHIGTTYRLPMPSGANWFELSIAAKKDPFTTEERFIALVRDTTERKRAEEALIQSEKKYRDIIESSSIPYALNDDHQNITLVNLAFVQTFGYTLEDIPTLADWWSKAYPDPDYCHWVVSTWQTRLETVKREGTRFDPLEVSICCKNGSRRIVLASATSLLDSFSGVHLVVLYDITDRKRAEQSLLESEERFRSLIEQSTDGVVLLDEQGLFIEWNRAQAEMTGIPREKALGASAWEVQFQLLPPERRSNNRPEIFQESMRSAFSTGQLPQFNRPVEFDIQTADGKRRTIIQTSFPIKTEAGYRIGGIVRDITERKQAELALKEREAQYRSLFENMHSGFILVEVIFDSVGQPVDHRLLQANVEFEAQTGLTRSEELGRTSAELSFKWPEEVARRYYHVALHGEPFHWERFNESLQRYYDVRAFSPCPGQFALLFNDITERKRVEEQLLRAQKLESLGILAGGVAHDFNNLLVALLGQTSLAAAKLPPDHAAQRHLERAVSAARHAADLTRQMLAYSGRGAFQMTPLNLNTLIRDITGFLESSIAKAIALRIDLAETLPLISADTGQLQQIIMNLVLNAAEAIGEHTGRIHVATSVIDVTADDGNWTHYTGQAVAAGRYVQLRVQDSGGGMSAETLDRIFDPFFTTKFTGRGLGLSAVQGIVRGHRGGLWVNSEVGLGTTFTLVFPATEAEVVVIPKPTTSQTAPTQQLVLIIDDEEPVLEAITDMLALDNVSTLCAAAGAEGIALFRERHTDIGLVLLDLSMPGLSGRETFEGLLEIDPQACVVLSSGYTRAEATRDFEGRPLVGFLHKPYDLELLLDTVRRHVRQREEN